MKQIFDTKQGRYVISKTGKVFINVNEREVQSEELDFEKNAKTVTKYEYDTDFVTVSNPTEENILSAFKEKKKNEARAYYNSDEVNLVNVNGVYVYLDPNLRFKIKERINAEKDSGNTTTNLNFGTIHIKGINIDTASSMLNAIILKYADAYDTEHTHESSIDALQTLEDVISYDVRSGYNGTLKL